MKFITELKILNRELAPVEDPAGYSDGDDPCVGITEPFGPGSGLVSLTVDEDELYMYHRDAAWAPSWSFSVDIAVIGFSDLDTAHKQRVVDILADLMRRNYHGQLNWKGDDAADAIGSCLEKDVLRALSDWCGSAVRVEVYELWSTNKYCA